MPRNATTAGSSSTVSVQSVLSLITVFYLALIKPQQETWQIDPNSRSHAWMQASDHKHKMFELELVFVVFVVFVAAARIRGQPRYIGFYLGIVHLGIVHLGMEA